MQVSVEISMYPLQEAYRDPIEAFIRRLRKHPNIEVQPNSMSTRIFGSYSDVMQALQEEMQQSMQASEHLVFVLKVIGEDLNHEVTV